MKLNLKRPIAFFDLETTGLNITHDRIVEVSVLRINVNSEEEQRTWRINPGSPIPPETTAIHGISDADVAHEKTFIPIPILSFSIPLLKASILTSPPP